MSLLSDGSQSPPGASRRLWAAGIDNLTRGTMTIVWPPARTPEPTFGSGVLALDALMVHRESAAGR